MKEKMKPKEEPGKVETTLLRPAVESEKISHVEADSGDEGFVEKDLIVNCKAVNTLRGIIGKGEVVQEDWFPGGHETIENLIRGKVLKRGK